MPLRPAASQQASQAIRAAYEDLERAVNPTDARDFAAASLEDVVRDARELEDQLAARGSLRNMRRLLPLFSGLEHYATAVDVLCKETPYLAWIWSPITLILRITSENAEAFEQIIIAYSKIAKYLGKLQALQCTVTNGPDMQQALAVLYADILQFHKHAYKIVRRSGWRLLFLTSWKRFESRFEAILDDMERHESFLGQLGSARGSADIRKMRKDITAQREESKAQLARLEENNVLDQFQSTMAWLKTDESDQLTIYESVSAEGATYPGTCNWLLKNSKVTRWLQRKADVRTLWLVGNPGTGKSVLVTQLLAHMKTAGMAVVYHFCDPTYASSILYEQILKLILLQLLRRDPELVAYANNDLVGGKRLPAIPVLEKLIRTILASISHDPEEMAYIWIVLDGFEACETEKQASLISLLNQITSGASPGSVCKVLIASRSLSLLSSRLRRKQTISLTEEKPQLESAIKSYASQRLRSMHTILRELRLEQTDIAEIEERITQKADGMFLYARLVFDYIEHNIFYNSDEIKSSVNELPKTISDFYRKILTQILVRLDSRSEDRVRCVFGWIAFAKRPLKRIELLSGISFSSGDPKVPHIAPGYILDICSALVEDRRGSTAAFIHSSVKEFLLSPSSPLVMSESKATNEHGLASVACLLSGLSAFSQAIDEPKRSLQAIEGLHALLLYSSEHWTDYVLQESTASKPDDILPSILMLAAQLAEVLEQANDGSTRNSLGSETESYDGRLVLLNSYPILQKHIRNAYADKSLSALESQLLETQDPDRQSSNEQDLSTIGSVSALIKSYQTTIRMLLQRQDYPGVTAEDFDTFKRNFQESAFTCRLASCPRATTGFESERLLLDHEMTHARFFQCQFAGCQYPPFGSARALKTHENKHHPTTMPQKSIRRAVKVSSQEVGALRATASPNPRSGLASGTATPPVSMQPPSASAKSPMSSTSVVPPTQSRSGPSNSNVILSSLQREQVPERNKEGRNILIHELAVQDQSFYYLMEKWRGDNMDLIDTLKTVAAPMPMGDKWSMKQVHLKELDVWNYSYSTSYDRRRAINNAEGYYTRQLLDPDDPAWERLLEEKDRISRVSSYWRPAEAADFPRLLSTFGSDWAAIAAHMRTKTAVMVKNYFTRQRDNGKQEWEELVIEADRRKARGESLPPPPVPTVPIPKPKADNSDLISQVQQATDQDLLTPPNRARLRSRKRPTTDPYNDGSANLSSQVQHQPHASVVPQEPQPQQPALRVNPRTQHDVYPDASSMQTGDQIRPQTGSIDRDLVQKLALDKYNSASKQEQARLRASACASLSSQDTQALLRKGIDPALILIQQQITQQMRVQQMIMTQQMRAQQQQQQMMTQQMEAQKQRIQAQQLKPVDFQDGKTQQQRLQREAQKQQQMMAQQYQQQQMRAQQMEAQKQQMRAQQQQIMAQQHQQLQQMNFQDEKTQQQRQQIMAQQQQRQQILQREAQKQQRLMQAQKGEYEIPDFEFVAPQALKQPKSSAPATPSIPPTSPNQHGHEQLQSGAKFVCKGDLKAGGQWGCGRRFDHADDLGNHLRSEAGRACINPLLNEEMLERQGALRQQQRPQEIPQSTTTQQAATDPNPDYILPVALLAQYPALASLESVRWVNPEPSNPLTWPVSQPQQDNNMDVDTPNKAQNIVEGSSKLYGHDMGLITNPKMMQHEESRDTRSLPLVIASEAGGSGNLSVPPRRGDAVPIYHLESGTRSDDMATSDADTGGSDHGSQLGQAGHEPVAVPQPVPRSLEFIMNQPQAGFEAASRPSAALSGLSDNASQTPNHPRNMLEQYSQTEKTMMNLVQYKQQNLLPRSWHSTLSIHERVQNAMRLYSSMVLTALEIDGGMDIIEASVAFELSACAKCSSKLSYERMIQDKMQLLFSRRQVLPSGALLHNQRYTCSTFTIPNHDDLLFMFADACATQLGYQSGDEFCRWNASLEILFPTQDELYYNPGSVAEQFGTVNTAVRLVTARSVVSKFGSRITRPFAHLTKKD